MIKSSGWYDSFWETDDSFSQSDDSFWESDDSFSQSDDSFWESDDSFFVSGFIFQAKASNFPSKP